ncbi:glycosyltransferase family 4 protein [Pelagibacterales bacterium SAG-MED50]|nr:glycosyltransferase family 4 protein [Pelagibacterales bacterium SAG-MED50]
MKHILFVTSYGPSLINFRLSLIKKLLFKGYKVSVASPKENFSNTLQKELKKLGVHVNIFSLSRTGLNFFQDCNCLFQIYKIIQNSKPNIIISYTSKPVIYTGLVLKFFKKIKHYPLITGLGYYFIPRTSIKYKIIKYLIIKLYREGLKTSKKIIFQNKDDQSLFLKLRIIKNKKITKIVNGSGVDLKAYPMSSLPSKPVFLMISRLLVDKGVREYAQAAEIVHSSFSNVTFQLAGFFDENPASINADELKSWINKGIIKYLGKIESVQLILKSCKFYVLPSYREGTPRSTLEALSTGRPVITTDVPGCRETVIHKKNGLLVPEKDPLALANAMMKLLKEKDKKIKKMAKESFLIAKNKYEINKVNQSILDIMNL